MFILDCTLRDGGYYNNWDFSSEIVEAYLNAVSSAKINYIELGLRNFPKAGFVGAYAYTTEQHLNQLNLPEGPTYGVMVDAKTILSSGLDPIKAVDALFVPCSESKIDLVRVAAHFHEVEQSGPIVSRLKELGYIVGYNLMQSGGKPGEVIAEKARIAKSWGDNLDVLYFADSLGNMDSVEVERIIQALRTEWKGPLGIHTHDNMSKGLDNSITAKNAGVEWLDATITGMGRGAGNTQTERLLAVLDDDSSYNPQPVYDLVVRHFEGMQKQYGWGTNLLYFLGAQNDVHPTYIQNLLSNSHFGTEEIVGAIGYLSQLDGTTSYNGSVLETAVSFNSTSNEVTGTDSLVEKFAGKEVLVIANGKTSKQYKDAIELYIKEKQPVVLSVNLVEEIDNSLVDYFVLSHNAKFLSDFEHYKQLSRPVILPKHRFSEQEMASLNHLEIFDVGFDSNADVLSVESTKVNSAYDLTSAYVLGLLALSKPEKVGLVGFDGYEKGDNRQQEMVDIIQQYNNVEGAISLTSLTPTTYPVQQGSIYAIHS